MKKTVLIVLTVVMLTLAAVWKMQQPSSPASSKSNNQTVARVIGIVLARPGALVLMGTAVALLVAATAKRARDSQPNRLLPTDLRQELEGLGHGRPLRHEALLSMSEQQQSLLGETVRGVLNLAAHKPDRSQFNALAGDVIETRLAAARAPIAWFGAAYGVFTLIGLLAMLTGMVEAFTNAGTFGTAKEMKAQLNEAIAAALILTAVGVLASIATRLIAEYFRQQHESTAARLKDLIRPLVVGLSVSRDS